MGLKQQQPPMTIEDQIQNLNSLGLIIEDRDNATKFLNDVSYFRFIKAYSLGLKAADGKYNQGVTFNQLTQLYLFNSNFRQLLFPQIERIEINLRCRLANYFSCKYGVLGYKVPANFSDPIYHQKILDEIEREIGRNKMAPFVKNFQVNYTDGDIPFYALIELFSFGSLSKFYKNMKNEDKKEVSSYYGVGYTYFESWLESLAFARNICAHYGRLYNFKLSKAPKLYKQYSNSKITNFRIFADILCMKHLLVNDRHWIEFVDSIGTLLEKYPHVEVKTMGFPENWAELLKNRESDSTA